MGYKMKLLIALFVLSCTVLSAQIDKTFSDRKTGMEKISADTNNDGKDDYFVYMNKANQKVLEEIDTNFDGVVDDIYVYANGVLILRELDSNFDGKTDIWVELSEGVYIKKYSRDKDFDGIPDVVKDYSK
jgi:hypothetical protein